MASNILHPSRRSALGLIGAALCVPKTCYASATRENAGAAFGTHWRLLAGEQVEIAGLAPEIKALYADIDARFSPWRPDSTISRFNAFTEHQLTDPDLVSVTAAALNLARQSEGAFDPTVGPLVAQWGFGPIRSGGAPDWRSVLVSDAGVVKQRPELTLDLCGIAKGWALDRTAQLARSAGATDMLLDLGGEFIAVGQHPDGRDWQVAVESPLNLQELSAVLRLPSGMAIATSGVRTQSYVLNGRLYSHIIDPASRSPVAGRLRSVTVMAETAMMADGWATALFAAGEAAGPDLAKTWDVSALFLIEDVSGLQQVSTGEMSDVLL